MAPYLNASTGLSCDQQQGEAAEDRQIGNGLVLFRSSYSHGLKQPPPELLTIT